MLSEAYHPEASKFCLYVGNYAGVFYLTNQKHSLLLSEKIQEKESSGTGLLFLMISQETEIA